MNVSAPLPARRDDAQLREANRRFYDPLWADARLVEPERFNTWPLVRDLVVHAERRIEVAPGLRPRLPIAGTQFVDLSVPAVAKLRSRGAAAVVGLVSRLPFASGSFDLVCALDIVEHVDDDRGAMAELSRIAAPGSAFLLSAPLHPSQWTAFDDFVGHRRRYEPEQLLEMLAAYGFIVERSAVFGMQPESSRLLDMGMWFLTHRRQRAMWLYNCFLAPLGVRFQKKLKLVSGMVATEKVDEVLLLCRKAT